MAASTGGADALVWGELAVVEGLDLAYLNSDQTTDVADSDAAPSPVQTESSPEATTENDSGVGLIFWVWELQPSRPSSGLVAPEADRLLWGDYTKVSSLL